MEKAFFLFILFAFSISLNAQQPIIKFYNNDGWTKQYKLADFENLSFIKSNLSYKMLIYNKNNGLKSEYDVREIDSIRFENNNKMKIAISDTILEHNIAEIDSIIFIWNTCEEIQIGTQIWMCKNLDVDHYRNGDSIPEVKGTEWINITTGAWCYYNNNPAMEVIYGKLYNWYAVNDPRGLAPAGWHVPSDAEWDTLTGYCDGTSIAGGKLKEVGTSHWQSPNEGATNESGFTALPGGYRFTFNFTDIGRTGIWWSSTEASVYYAWYRSLNYNDAYNFRYANNKGEGLSVRCVKDK